MFIEGRNKFTGKMETDIRGRAKGRKPKYHYNEDIMKTQVYDEVDTYDTLDYTENSVKKTNNSRTNGRRTTTKSILISKPSLDATKIKQTVTYHICVDMKPNMDYSANL